VVISVDAEKAFDKIHHPLMIKALNKLGIEGAHFNNIIKATYDRPVVNIILNEEKQTASSTVRNRQRCPLSPLLFNVMFEAIRQEKENVCQAFTEQRINIQNI
jgi:retron-type reverse transcriptase